MPNVNDQFFDGSYKDIWRAMIPEKLTEKEIEFMLAYFDLQPGMKVIDLMCGYGRHALALGRRGIEVLAIDNLGDYTHEIIAVAGSENLPVKVLTNDILDFQASGVFDLAICMGNSLNFFNGGDVMKIFTRVAAHLKTGGHFLINSWSLAEIALEKFRENSSSEIAGIQFRSQSKLLSGPTRIETESVMVNDHGVSEIKKGIDYIYSIADIEAMSNKTGLILKKAYSIPGKKIFEPGDVRAYIVCEKTDL
ncbi:MAG TPA: class I SAM-dependent methyltransferase [Chitinophagaceae bacterium]|nr:class I SAM-dependent methyltransferase [Chitinophagaceae bacterium]